MRVDLLTREYPPHIYGGAGVHVTELAKVLRAHAEVHVHAFDGPRPDGGATHVTGYDYCAELDGANAALQTLGVDLQMAQQVAGADILHSHTWYANMAGHWGALLHDLPHVISAHSLEPLRPWKAEQLGGGYRLSSWAERTAYEGAAGIIAVSNGMREDILRSYPKIDPERVHVIHNGIDLDEWKRPSDEAEIAAVCAEFGIDPDRPAVMFVGRITRQKGVPFLLRALRELDPEVQIILCAGAPDTKEIMAEVEALVDQLKAERDQVVWISQMLDHDKIVALLAASTVFVTPSVYEPLGIVNLEAMAVGLPVVGTATGGIPDVIVEGETGLLIPIEQADDGTGTPLHPDQFVADMAQRLNAVLRDPQRAREMGQAGRKRVEEHFTWTAIGQRTMELYRQIIG